MTPEERHALAKEVAGMVLLQVFVPMEKMAATLLIAHDRIDDQRKAIVGLMDLIKEMILDQPLKPRPKPTPKPSLSVVPLGRPAEDPAG